MSYRQDLYQRVILDHNKTPRNFREMPCATHQCEGRNPLCGDHIKVFLLIDNKNKIEDISFTGTGCAISKASSSMMTEFAKGKTVEQLKVCFEQFVAMTKGHLDLQEENQLGKLQLFEGVKEFSSRVKCANLSWHALKGSLEKSKQISTEESAEQNKQFLEESVSTALSFIHETLDLTGVKCPINFVKAKVKLASMPNKAILALILDAGDPIRNVPESLQMEGQKIVSQTKLNNQYRVLVQKIST